jgi:polyhydroxyalkanoate synthase
MPDFRDPNMAPLDMRDPATWPALQTHWDEAQRLWAQWWSAPAMHAPPTGGAVPATFDPAALAALNARLAPQVEALLHATVEAGTGAAVPEVIAPLPGDRRFSSVAWRDQPYYALVKQWYLLYAEYCRGMTRLAPVPAAERRRLEFATRQYLDAIAPSNFPVTNPDVLARAIATDGASVVQGLRNLAEDTERGRITMTDEAAFAVGRNLALTPGRVIFRNDLIELIQYDASTPTVHKRPLVIIPPCINKYYILDLQPGNSFVRHTVAQGQTVFLVSWRNVPESLGGLTWDDYIEEGVIRALRVAQDVGASRQVNALGFCVGGTLLASALAVLAARRDTTVASATLLTTMLDFADPGEIGVYVTREFLESREAQLLAGQRVPGADLANAFASLRANDLVWNYVVGNYLKGETPPAFDLLYWNGDSTNLPGPMYAYYLRNLYLDNRLRERGALTMAGSTIDLHRVVVPTYIYASREDHIVPWRSAYKSAALLGGDCTFVLGASGHIAGVVNPPVPVKRNYWTNDLLTDAPEDWLERANSVPGSWWPHWSAWLAARAGPQRAAPAAAGNERYPALEAAPGRYVQARA